MTTYYKSIDYLYRTLDDRQWVTTAPTEIRQYPRTPYEAVSHAVYYMDSPETSSVPWTGRGMTAVARCFGLQSADTGLIPSTIPGPRYAGIRQFRWLMQTYPEFAVQAPNPYTFGDNVPMGAVLYWDESTPEGGGVGIAAGYRNDVLQILMVTNDPTKTWGLRDIIPYGCAGWTVPLFYARSSSDLWNLWDGDRKTVPSTYDFSAFTIDPSASTYDVDLPYDISRVDREGIW